MTPDICRAARAWIGFTQADLARAANVAERTIRSYESGHTSRMQPNRQAAIRAALEANRLRFGFDTNGYPCLYFLPDTGNNTGKMPENGRKR